MPDMSRRSFLKAGTAAAMGLSLNPEKVIAKERLNKISPSDRLNILAVGVGGRGADDLRELERENIIGLCDVDWNYAKKVFSRYPQAKKYNDYRRMFDDMLREADAVLVATADHTHAIIVADALSAGKHVYCEKPLAHSIYETRLLGALAAKYQLATQVGNQGASAAGVRKICSWIKNGEIGEVRMVEAFTDRPVWPQGIQRPSEVDPVPATLNWDGFLGPAKYRPFSHLYTPWNFRGWCDFGTGALGDMGTHILHPVFEALDLRYPISVESSSTPCNTDSFPYAQTVRMVFPERDNLPFLAMPQLELTWYDGGLKPFRPEGIEQGRRLLNDGGGVIFYGTRDTLVCGGYGQRPYLLSGREPETPEVLRVISETHQMDWVRACKEYPEYRTACASDFVKAGPLNEAVVLGTIATALQDLNMTLEWDGEAMEFTNLPDEARHRAQEMIKHTYREGWKLPPMPDNNPLNT